VYNGSIQVAKRGNQSPGPSNVVPDVGGWTSAVAVIVALGAWGCNAHATDQKQVGLLAERLRAAYSARRADGVLALWSERSPQRAAELDTTSKLFGSDAAGTVWKLTVHTPRIDGDRARVRIDREAIASIPAAPDPARRKTELILECVKEQGGWKIWQETPAVQDLAARLASAVSEKERGVLLAENKDLPGADLASALVALARAARNRADFQLALKIYGVASDIAERAGADRVRSLILNNSGLIYYDQGDFARALDKYRQSLALSERLHDDAAMANSFSYIGSAYSDSGELPSAWESLQRSLDIGEKLHDKLLIARALGNMAIVHGRRGDYLQAFSLFRKVYELHQQDGNQRTLAIDMLNLGNLFLYQGDHAQSQDYFQKALALSEAGGLKQLKAIALMSLGNVAEDRGEPRAAIGQYEQSLATFTEAGDKPNAASNLSFMGRAYAALDDHTRALEYLQKALAIQKDVGAGDEAGLTLARLAAEYNQKGDFQQASRAAQDARAMAEHSGLQELLWRAHLEEGKARRGLGQAAQAEAELARSIATIEQLRLAVAGAEAERENYFEDKLEPYHRMIDLLVTSGRDAEAFNYAERAKARALLDAFKTGHAQIREQMTSDERQREQAFHVQLASLNARLVRSGPSLSPSELAPLTADRDRTRLEYERFETGLYAQHPQWRLQSGQIEPIALERALQMLANPDDAFVEFVVTEDKLFTFVASGGPRTEQSVRVFTTILPRKELQKRVERLGQQLAGRDLGFRTSSAELYRLLLAPIGDDLLRKRRITLVPDSVLWELPFQALVDSNGHYLLEDGALSYAPSLTALDAMRQVKKERRQSGDRRLLLAMGNPVQGSQAQERLQAVLRDQDLGSLPQAETEVLRLRQIYGADQSHIYTGRQASERQFKAEASDARIVHLATHGILNNVSPLYSYLLLAPGDNDAAEDGLLEARELMQMNLHAELVVLSACETARGRVGAGEGIIGLSWALFVSGVPTTVLSQWKVESESTTRLMIAFHENRKSGLSEAEALRVAALGLKKDPLYSHPFYWAPFIALGAAFN
jgi:CHAT domain-containing protein